MSAHCVISGDCGRNVVLSCVLCAFSAVVCIWALFVVFYQKVDYFGSLCVCSRAESQIFEHSLAILYFLLDRFQSVFGQIFFKGFHF